MEIFCKLLEARVVLNMAIILGVDPGTHNTGYGIVEILNSGIVHVDHGTLKATERSLEFRLEFIGSSLQELFKKYRPQSIAVESIFLGKNADSAFKLGHARGVVLYEAAVHKIPVVEYAAREVKKGMTGHGNAEKEQVRNFVLNLLKLSSNKSLDSTDALALAVYHAQRFELRATLKSRGLDFL